MLVLYTLDMEWDLHRQIKSAVLLRNTGFAGYNTLAKVGVEQADALVHYVRISKYLLELLFGLVALHGSLYTLTCRCVWVLEDWPRQ